MFLTSIAVVSKLCRGRLEQGAILKYTFVMLRYVAPRTTAAGSWYHLAAHTEWHVNFMSRALVVSC